MTPLSHIKRVLQFDLGSDPPLFGTCRTLPTATVSDPRRSVWVKHNDSKHSWCQALEADSRSWPSTSARQHGFAFWCAWTWWCQCCDVGTTSTTWSGSSSIDLRPCWATWKHSWRRRSNRWFLQLGRENLPTRRGVSQTAGQCKGQVPSPVRPGDEGVGPGLITWSPSPRWMCPSMRSLTAFEIIAPKEKLNQNIEVPRHLRPVGQNATRSPRSERLHPRAADGHNLSTTSSRRSSW